MAELASATAAMIMEKLGSIAYRELSWVFDIESELTELQATMTTIKAVLLDAEKKQASNRALSTWLEKLKDIFYEAEDVLDEVEYDVQRKRVIKTYGREVRGTYESFTAFGSRKKIGPKICNIRKRLGKIAAEKDQFDLTTLEDRHVTHRRRDMTHSVPPSDAIGRNGDKENMIIRLLRQPSTSRNVEVIPIVGIGGLGKTTLAKLVYHDKHVAEHFKLRMWVCVSQDFDVTRLIKEILKESGVGIDENSSTISTSQTQLIINKLKNGRFLLVLDDVWNEDHNKWFNLRDLLLGGFERSRILVTTRSNKVAAIMGTVPAYNLKGLSQNDCLSLFVKYAFKEGEDKQYPNLLEIGKEIVEKCKGVPLAIRTLGSLLFSKVDELQYWKFVRDNEIWRLEQKDDDILPALKLSYDQMSSHLKQCFALCSLFPKDHKFDSGELIAFWMAHGLLNTMPNSQNLELEDVGDMYFKELWSRSFFQDVERDFWYCGYGFKMHDLVHDLALKVAEKECSIIGFHTQNIDITAHHLSFLHNGRQVPNCFYKLSKGVRTTVFPTEQHVSTLVEECISRFKCLRVLDLSHSSFEVMSESIDTLKHLRYLKLAGNDNIKHLPPSISKLYNLQTLLLHGCSSLERLPKATRKMINLRHLTVTTTYTCLFKNDVHCLNSLQFLLISRCPRLENLFQGMDKSLTKLRTLVVSCCESLTSLTLDIKDLAVLETLVIDNCKELSLTGGEDNRDFKLRLRKLKICNLPMLEFLPQWLKESADTLQFLSISFCENFMALPAWLSSLKSLQTLEIIGCPKLSSLPEGIVCLTALGELTIEYCDELIRKCKEEDRFKIANISMVRLVD